MLHAYVHNSKLKNAAIRMVFQYWVTFTKDKQVIVIKHVEKDIYTKEGETRISSDRPHYFHATLQCLQYKHPYFNRSLLEIDSDMFESLTAENKDTLNALQ